MYDKVLGIISTSGYEHEKKVAKLIADTIGLEDLIKMHYNHDYEGIRQSFKENTGTELNDLVKKLHNKPKFNILLNSIPIVHIVYKINYNNKKRKFNTDLNQSIQDIEKQYQAKNRTDFIPKIDVNSPIITHNIQENIKNKENTLEGPEAESR